MNMWHKMVKENIGSALIMEDDADWDVHIVQQMQQFADVSRGFLAKDPNSLWRWKKRTPTGSPYGEGWDLLWIGHCGGSATPNLTESNPNYVDHVAIIRDETTVPPGWDMKGLVHSMDPNGSYTCSAHKGMSMPPGIVCDSPWLADNERLLQERTAPLCTTGYAISLQGARKLLARLGGLSLDDIRITIDQEMAGMCR
jgi:GR25 family glycosyltransferase involved in LPS biosynthesis